MYFVDIIQSYINCRVISGFVCSCGVGTMDSQLTPCLQLHIFSRHLINKFGIAKNEFVVSNICFDNIYLYINTWFVFFACYLSSPHITFLFEPTVYIHNALVQSRLFPIIIGTDNGLALNRRNRLLSCSPNAWTVTWYEKVKYNWSWEWLDSITGWKKSWITFTHKVIVKIGLKYHH